MPETALYPFRRYSRKFYSPQDSPKSDYNINVGKRLIKFRSYKRRRSFFENHFRENPPKARSLEQFIHDFCPKPSPRVFSKARSYRRNCRCDGVSDTSKRARFEAASAQEMIISGKAHISKMADAKFSRHSKRRQLPPFLPPQKSYLSASAKSSSGRAKLIDEKPGFSLSVSLIFIDDASRLSSP